MNADVRATVDAIDPHPTTSMALVPLVADRAPMRPAARVPALPPNLHLAFYGLWYAGVGALALGGWMMPRDTDAMIGFYVLGALALRASGLGILVHTLLKARMQKLRRALGALAALALCVAAQGVIGDVSREVDANARIVRLQPLADELIRDGRVRTLDISRPGFVELNGSRSALDGSIAEGVDGGPPLLIDDLLRRDRIARAELLAMAERLREIGVSRVEVRDGYVGFDSRHASHDLVYVRPGQVLPSPGMPVMQALEWRTRPVGGGWYIFEG